MSDILQPGQQTTYQAHPDADQLAAFAEHTLPLHEQQQTLAHVATCAGCRQIIFLAQQAEEVEAAEPMPVKVRNPWLSGWNLAWPAVLALAGIIAFSVHLRNFSRPGTPTETVTTAKMEQPNLTPALPSPQQAGQGTEVKKKVAVPPVTSAVAPGIKAQDAVPMVVEQKSRANPTMAKADSQPVVIQGAAAGAAQASVSSAASAPAPLAFSGRNSMRLGSVSSGLVRQQIQTSEAAANDKLSQDQVATAPVPLAAGAAQPAGQLSRAMPAPPPPAPQAGPISGANETVTVEASSAAGLPTTSTSSLAMLAPRLPLPSHSPADSTASVGAVTLSLDAQGKLFLTKDQGHHWKQIKASWGGRAVRIGTAEPAPTAIFVLTTDAGSVWTSYDGQHWKGK